MRYLGPLSALVLLAVLVACGGERTLQRVEPGKSITILRSDKSGDLDPMRTSSGGDVRVLSQIYEHLVRASVDTPEVEWQPGLAESWEINDDHTMYTFRIRQGVTFHDGAKLDAHAVKKSLDRMVVEDHPARPQSRPYRGEYFGDIESVVAKDDWTVVISHINPNPRFLGTLGIHGAMIISPKAIDAMAEMPREERHSWLTRNAAGTGPFKLENYESDTLITLRRFDDYWQGKPTIERIVFRTATEIRSRMQELRAGSVHFIDSIDPGDWDALNADEGIDLYTWPAQNVCYLALNCNPEHGFITADVRVRRAIAMAVNREPMVAKFSGGAVAHHVMIPPTMMGFPGADYLPTDDRPPVSERREQARALLAEAGAEGARVRMYVPDTPRPYLLYPVEIADLLVQQLRQIGLNVVVDKGPLHELTQRVHAGEFPLVLIGWMSDNGEPDNFWRPLLSGTGGQPAGQNNARFFDQEVADLVNKAGNETDRSRRIELYRQLETTVHDQHRPIVPLLSAHQSYAWRSNLKEVIIDSTGDFHFHKAYFED
jgi:peptide/nickel transport system substrate-binding protein